MNKDVIAFRDGVFALRTRRFGTVAELMIRKLFNFKNSKSHFHDLYDDSCNNRIEVKFSTVLKENEARINEKNLIEQCLSANISIRAMKSCETNEYRFDCNIQQVKRAEFDVLYYGLFFADRIAIFMIDSNSILGVLGYSDFQHKGNSGEGQFHLNQDSIEYHKDNHFVKWLSYNELFDLFSK